MGTQLPPKGAQAQFPAHARCGQMARWIKMPLGMEESLSGHSVNLRCRSETCCTQLTENTGCKKSPKNRQLGTITQLCHTTKGKKLVKQQYLLHTCAQNGELQPITAEICLPVWGTPANFNGFRILLLFLQRCCSPEANQTLHDVWPSPMLVHYIYIFGGSCPLTEFCLVQNSLYIQVLRSPILVALLHGTPVVGISQTLRRSTRNGITELSHRAPPILGWAAIMLDIGPHFSFSIIRR